MSYKEIQKSMKGPDKFQIFFAKTTKWCLKHKTLWIVLFSLIVCACLVLIGSHLYVSKRSSARQIELTALEAGFDKADKSKNKEQVEAYKGYFNKYNSHPEGWIAAVKAVTLLIGSKDFAEARGLLESVLTKSKKYSFYQTHCSLLLINVLDELGEVDAALQRADEFLKFAPQELKPKVLLTKGRMLLAQNKIQEADVVLNSIINDFGTSTEASKARLLKGTGNL